MNTWKSLLQKAKKYQSEIAFIDKNFREKIILHLADAWEKSSLDIIRENQKDLEKMNDDDPKKDRLMLNQSRMNSLLKSIRHLVHMKSPSGKILYEHVKSNGLRIQKKLVPFGVIAMVYESRPNVTMDAICLGILSGNAMILRGGSDAYYTNKILVTMAHEVLRSFSVPEWVIYLMPTERELVSELLISPEVDLVIPRGSQALIDFVMQTTRAPVIQTGAGVCHTYIDAEADIDMAINIVNNAKNRRTSICSCLDTIVLHEKIAKIFLTLLSPVFAKQKVGIYADKKTYKLLGNYSFLYLANESDFGREFLSSSCSICVVNNFDEAIEHIQQYSSGHSEAIVTKNSTRASEFMLRVDSAIVYHNVSTQFSDGVEFGIGSEIGISTQKSHARGPFGLEKLFCEKWFAFGSGQVRE